MNKEQILKKAIEKAEKNGFKNFDWDKIDRTIVPINNIIFSHDFAKAFWGEELEPVPINNQQLFKWEYHLQQLVLEEEPLDYLKQFLI